MATYFDTSKLFVMAKIENTPGTDPTPAVGTNDIPVMRDSGGVKRAVGRTDGVRIGSPFGGVLVSPNGNTMPTASYRIPIYGKGLSTGVIQLPVWVTQILATCCDVFIGTSDTSQCLLTPNMTAPLTTDSAGSVTANKRTFTVYEYSGQSGTPATGTKTLIKLHGCRVSAARWKFALGQVAALELDIVAQIVTTPTEVTTDLSAATLDSVSSNGDFITFNGMTTTLTPEGGSAITCSAKSLNIVWDFGGKHVEGDNATSGVATTAQTDVTASGDIDPLVAVGDLAAMIAPITDAESYALAATANGVFPASRSGNTGYGFKPACARLQPAGSGPELDRGDTLIRLPLAFEAKLPSVDGAPFTMQIL